MSDLTRNTMLFIIIQLFLKDGQVKVWDNNTGELLTQINRKQCFDEHKISDNLIELDDLSDYESGSPPSRDEIFPRLLNRINTDFSHVNDCSPSSDSKYNFNKSYRHYYFNHNYDVKSRNEKTLKRQSLGESLKVVVNDSNCESVSKRESVGGGKTGFNRESSGSSSDFNSTVYSPVWCMDYVDNLIVIGCADGRLEFWEATTGKLKVNLNFRQKFL